MEIIKELSKILNIKEPKVLFIYYNKTVFATKSTIACAEVAGNTIFCNLDYINNHNIPKEIVLSCLFHELKHIEQYKNGKVDASYISNDQVDDLRIYYMQPNEYDALCFQEIATQILLGFSMLDMANGLDDLVASAKESLNKDKYYIDLAKMIRRIK